jgi:hypothetical protein
MDERAQSALANVKVSDPELYEAIEFMNFNYHHDRGVPQLPSSFIDNALSRTDIALQLYVGLRISQQPVHFKNPVKNLARAEKFLRAFWAVRLEEEKTLWKTEGVDARTTLQMSSGVEVRGLPVATKFAKDGTLAYLQFSGETELFFRGEPISGQGVDRHKTGFGTPVGSIKGFARRHEMMQRDLQTLGLTEGTEGRVVMASGVTVSGIFRGADVRDGKVITMTFDACTVKHGDDILYRPEWGPYDMIVARELVNIAG